MTIHSIKHSYIVSIKKKLLDSNAYLHGHSLEYDHKMIAMFAFAINRLLIRNADKQPKGVEYKISQILYCLIQFEFSTCLRQRSPFFSNTINTFGA